MGEDIGATRFDWQRQILAAKLPFTTKLVALAAATYADPNGTRVFPGCARLAVVCGISYDTVRKALRGLRAAGLIEQVRRGSRRKATEYRLIFAEDLMERLEWLTPAQIELEAERLNRAHAEGSAKREARRKLRYPDTADRGASRGLHEGLRKYSPELTETPASSSVAELRYGDAADNSNCGTGTPETAVPPSQPPDHRTDHTSTRSISGDLPSELAATRAREAEEEPPKIRGEEEDRNRAGGTAPRRRWSTPAERAIAEAQARMAARRAAHTAADGS